jgi:hypothetical protein
MQYVYTKTPVSVDRLTQEIQQSEINVALDVITVFGTEVTITFKAALSEVNEDTLDSIVNAHTGEPLPSTCPQVEVTSLPEPQPFAVPTYRTKRNCTEIVTIAAGEAENIEHLLIEERYVTGGTLIVEGATFGDYVTASIIDKDGVIPEAYRAAICEDWPTVATYIEKTFVEVEDGTTTRHRIDTYPLNAKITQGLYLRLTYNATSDGVARKAAVNYYLSKKLG